MNKFFVVENGTISEDYIKAPNIDCALKHTHLKHNKNGKVIDKIKIKRKEDLFNANCLVSNQEDLSKHINTCENIKLNKSFIINKQIVMSLAKDIVISSKNDNRLTLTISNEGGFTTQNSSPAQAQPTNHDIIFKNIIMHVEKSNRGITPLFNLDNSINLTINNSEININKTQDIIIGKQNNIVTIEDSSLTISNSPPATFNHLGITCDKMYLLNNKSLTFRNNGIIFKDDTLNYIEISGNKIFKYYNNTANSALSATKINITSNKQMAFRDNSSSYGLINGTTCDIYNSNLLFYNNNNNNDSNVFAILIEMNNYITFNNGSLVSKKNISSQNTLSTTQPVLIHANSNINFINKPFFKFSEADRVMYCGSTSSTACHSAKKKCNTDTDCWTGGTFTDFCFDCSSSTPPSTDTNYYTLSTGKLNGIPLIPYNTILKNKNTQYNDVSHEAQICSKRSGSKNKCTDINFNAKCFMDPSPTPPSYNGLCGNDQDDACSENKRPCNIGYSDCLGTDRCFSNNLCPSPRPPVPISPVGPVCVQYPTDTMVACKDITNPDENKCSLYYMKASSARQRASSLPWYYWKFNCSYDKENNQCVMGDNCALPIRFCGASRAAACKDQKKMCENDFDCVGDEGCFGPCSPPPPTPIPPTPIPPVPTPPAPETNWHCDTIKYQCYKGSPTGGTLKSYCDQVCVHPTPRPLQQDAPVRDQTELCFADDDDSFGIECQYKYKGDNCGPPPNNGDCRCHMDPNISLS